MSPRLSVPIIPAIIEVDSPFEKLKDKVSVSTLRSRGISSIFEEIIVPDPSIYRWLLDIISQAEDMTKESAHFILSEPQLIRVIAYTFDVVEIDLSEYYTETEVDGLISEAAICELIDAYTKTETDSKLVLKADKTDIIDAYTKAEDDALLLLKADKSTTYTKTETDTLLDAKADKTDIIEAYTKTETDTKLDLKDDKSEIIDSYTKYEDDVLLLLKADKSELIDSYTKTETDTLLDAKTDKTDLDYYVDLTSAQTVNGTKQFNIISAATVSKQNKNDASILLAGGGDMLVTSLVTQPQLQEVRDIATGKSKAHVFSTQEELNDWIAIQDNVANLATGDNLYIVDKLVTDYWWDGTYLKVLKTEQPDMSNVFTTLGVATRNGNAIIDISIEGNTLTSSKNATFVTTEFDQSITGMKTFTNTIISNGIQYSGYDNTSVFLAEGEVRAISDINASVDLTDYYNQTKTDELLGDKANSADLDNYYEKHDVDEMINDANELIRAVEDQIPPPATISNFVQKTREDLDQIIQVRLRQQLDEKVPFDSMSENLYKTKFDALEGLVTSETFNDQLLDKADKTDLNSYVTLGADNTVVLLGAGGTKPISEFVSAPIDQLSEEKNELRLENGELREQNNELNTDVRHLQNRAIPKGKQRSFCLIVEEVYQYGDQIKIQIRRKLKKTISSGLTEYYKHDTLLFIDNLPIVTTINEAIEEEFTRRDVLKIKGMKYTFPYDQLDEIIERIKQIVIEVQDV
ncbi:MAG: hypothetical protein EZS28_012437 [Streblomastix strix]|uniref:Uncharacterized protein n=1 Tax=Streblomastix strix TaxID=222440 RepID=A0A5J4WBU3_9EUKA|nr:MAG: hypothetical protein EZS28_012437 [Streblomastix strix]